MRPAFSVIFLTTLSGAGQGLFLALFACELAGREPPRAFFVAGALAAVALSTLGLAASFFHLGRPGRAWRSAAMWRTSWLSREVIALPAFLAAAAGWGLAHAHGSPWTSAIGAVAAAACVALYVCTGMIYACIKFLQEWASPLTVVNFLLMGAASGFMIATPLAALLAPAELALCARGAILLTLIALLTRLAALRRNARIVPRSTIQSAIGIAATRIEQKSQGFTGGAFNTREFFHRAARSRFEAIKWTFLVLAFALPLLLAGIGIAQDSLALLAAAPVVQYAGLLAERWFFLAQASHPQNLYYQCAS